MYAMLPRMKKGDAGKRKWQKIEVTKLLRTPLPSGWKAEQMSSVSGFLHDAEAALTAWKNSQPAQQVSETTLEPCAVGYMGCVCLKLA